MSSLPSRTAIKKLELVRNGSVSWAAIGISACGESELLSIREGILHQREADIFGTDRFGRWRFGYLRGRLCAKLALGALHDGLDVRQVSIERGVFGQPVVASKELGNVQVSISHSGNWAAALAFDETHPMAIDIEVFAESKQAVMRGNMTAAELDWIAATNLVAPMRLTVLWTIKESLSKALRSGLMSPFEIYAIDSIEEQGVAIVSTYTNFAQYKCISFAIGEPGMSITLPRRTEVDLTLAGWDSIFQLDNPRSPGHPDRS